MKYKRYIHAGLTMFMVLIFLTGAISKLVPSLKPAGFDPVFLIKSVTENNYKNPASFQITLTAMQESGFLVMIGLVQLLSCVLMILPRTRLLGLLLLLPMTFNILMMHAIMNDSITETIKCSVLFTINLILIGYYYKIILPIWRKIGHSM